MMILLFSLWWPADREKYFKSSGLDGRLNPSTISSRLSAHAMLRAKAGCDCWVLMMNRGRVRHLEVIEASPARTFDDSALAAFRQLTFHGAGARTLKSYDLKVDFNLDALTE